MDKSEPCPDRYHQNDSRCHLDNASNEMAIRTLLL